MTSSSSTPAAVLAVLAGSLFTGFLFVLAAAASAQEVEGGPPPDARPGQCFAKFRHPARTETVMEHTLVTPERLSTTTAPGPCRLEMRTEVVRPATTSLIHVPALTHMVSEQVMVRPPGYRTETLAPVIETVTETVVVRPARREWRLSPAPAFAAPSYAYGLPVTPTGEVLCLVEVPAVVRLMTRQIVRVPARTITVQTPPIYETVSHLVVDAPAHDERHDDPGETRTYSERVCAPPRTVETITPALFSDTPSTRIIEPARTEWREIPCAPAPPAPRPLPIQRPAPRLAKGVWSHPCDCGRSRPHKGRRDAGLADAPGAAPAVPGQGQGMGPSPAHTQAQPQARAAAPAQAPSAAVGDLAVRHLQEALVAKGYYHGPIDGLFTKDTAQGMTRFQHDRHLAEGRYTGETADALGLH